MKNIFPLLIFIFVTSTVFAQKLYTRNDSIAITQDSVTIKVGQHRGSIQWQKTLDSKDWINLEGKTTDSLKIKSDDEAMYRATITEGSCLPIYSDTAIIKINSNFSVFDMRQNSEWDYWVIAKDGSSFYVKVQNQIPVSVYYKPSKNLDGYSIFFNDFGVPTKLVIDGYILLFDNFRDKLVDVSLILPSGEIKIIRDVDSNFNLNPFNLKKSQLSQGDEWTQYAIKTTGELIGVTSCVGGIIATGTGVGAVIGVPLLIGCASTVVGLVTDVLPENFQILGLTVGTTSDIMDVISCATGQNLLECAEIAGQATLSAENAALELLNNNASVTTAQNLIRLPTITTSDVTSITPNAAICGGNITSEGGAPVTDRGVCWSKYPIPTISDDKTNDGLGNGSFTSNLTGLDSNTTYYTKAYATNTEGTRYGDLVTFKTTFIATSPIVGSDIVTNITQTTATLAGWIDTDNGQLITALGVCWSTSIDPTIDGNKTMEDLGKISFTSTITGLLPNTSYFARAYATNSLGTGYGNNIGFTTEQFISKPTISTNPITSITQTTATSGGNITSNGSAPITASGICWSILQDPTTATDFTTDGNNSSFSSNLTGLTANTTYYVWAYAINSVGTAFGNQETFNTTGISIETGTVKDIDGNVYQTVKIGDQWWMAENLRTTKFNDGASIPIVTDNNAWINLTTPGYCWYNNDASNGALYNWYSINTNKLAPAGWHVSSDEEWTTLENYLISNGYNYDGTTVDNKVAKSLAAITGWSVSYGTGDVGNLDYPSNRNITGFTALPIGYRYGLDALFYQVGLFELWWSSTEASNNTGWYRTLSFNGFDLARNPYIKQCGLSIRCVKDNNSVSIVVPTLSTYPITDITQTTANSGGNITSNGGAPITASGICWSTSQNPTTANSKTTDGSGIGSFTSSLGNLAVNTKYFVRAYASNSAGIAYGNEVTFSALSTYYYINGNSFGVDVNGNSWNIWSANGSNIWDWQANYIEGYLHYSFKIFDYTGYYCSGSCRYHNIWNKNPCQGFEISNVKHDGGIFPESNMNDHIYKVDIQWNATGYHSSVYDITSNAQYSDNDYNYLANSNTYDSWTWGSSVWAYDGSVGYWVKDASQHAADWTASVYGYEATGTNGGGGDIRTDALPVMQ